MSLRFSNNYFLNLKNRLSNFYMLTIFKLFITSRDSQTKRNSEQLIWFETENTVISVQFHHFFMFC
jgi:hypothetical protein